MTQPFSGPSGLENFRATVNMGRLYFRFATSRPKASITLDKRLFGIPSEAQIYLFAQNHVAMNHVTEDVKEAFLKCLEELPEQTDNISIQPLATFLKIFSEGGFMYNDLIATGGTGARRSYLPKMVGVAAMGPTPAFEGQIGISTGYPYHVPPQFFQYVDTVPVSIDAISNMSERHGRYGLCFTRCAFVWDGGALESSGMLDFSCPAPDGGFFYVPDSAAKYEEIGAFLYAFGESKEF